jgi:hypothetical protein
MRITTLLSLLSIFTTIPFVRSWDTKDECPIEITTVITRNSWRARPRSFWDGYDPRFDTMDSVHAALSHCPNITKLDLRIADMGDDCSPDRYLPLEIHVGKRLANLTSVRLAGYGLGGIPEWCAEEYPQRTTTVQRIHKTMSATKIGRMVQGLLNLAPQKTHLALWMDAMDWSRVEEFMIKGEVNDGATDEMVEKLAPNLHSLKALETRNTSFISALPNNTLTHLKSVAYEHDETAFATILEHQGKSLQHLEFRSPETGFGPFLADYDISLLPKMARNLTHLVVNIPRNGTWPLESLDMIASLPQLWSAEIHTNIQSLCAQQRDNLYSAPYFENYRDRIEYWSKHCTGEERFQKPFLDKEGAEEMFGYMRKDKKGVELRNVTFYVGGWGHLRGVDRFDGKKAKVVCREEGNRDGDDDGWCIVEAGEGYWKEVTKDENSFAAQGENSIELCDADI